MKDNLPLQRHLFELIKRKSENPRTWCSIYQKDFFVSKSAAYKQVNGDNSISFDEGLVLMRHHKISLDEVLKGEEDKIGKSSDG
jgi:hypothetical protein